MALTKPFNTKSNVKQITGADIPFAPRSTVLSSYRADSTASQTVINLGFSVDQANTDVFFLFIDGRKLSLGSTADFTFTSVDQNNYSSQVTLNSPVIAGLQIEAYKLAAKRDNDVNDNRWAQAFEFLGDGFQGFVNPTESIITATTATGSPAAGTFHSSIVGRSSMTDLSANLKSQMGVERIPIQQIMEIQNEFGPSGQRVWGALNDDKNQIRFVGDWLYQQVGDGSYPVTNTNNTNDFIEVTFYGTGLNLLTMVNSGSRDMRVAVDSDTYGSNIYPSTGSGILQSRNTSINNVLSAATNLSLGIHTVKIKFFTIASNRVYGFEILNESTSIKTNSGVGFNQGKKVVTSAQDASAYASGFTNIYGSAGARGGRVLVYQDSSGNIKKDIRYAEASQSNLTSADHTNEEALRTYHYREFGAGRADDFSLIRGTNGQWAYTLDDGTTTLVGQDVDSLQLEAARLTTNNTSQLILTFVGTGCDMIWGTNNSGTNTNATAVQIHVDGISIGNLPQASPALQSFVNTKIVSGLPYGTHTVRIALGVTDVWVPQVAKFVVYGPKKPVLPANAIEIADYNIMADPVVNTITSTVTAGLSGITTGVLRKGNTREMVYVGAGWSILAADVLSFIGGFDTRTSTSGNYVEYAFWGTGFDLRFTAATNRSADVRVTLDGGSGFLPLISSNFSFTSSVYGTGVTYDATTNGVLDQNDATTTYGSGFRVSGLTLKLYKVRFTNNTANIFSFNSLDIITPIHSHKSNLYGDIQNTLPVGSCAISDNRKLTPVKEILPVTKAWAQALAVTADPSSSSTAFVPVPDMSVSIKTSGGSIQIDYSMVASISIADQYVKAQVYVDGVAVGFQRECYNYATAGGVGSVNDCIIVPVSPGVHKVDLYWRTTTGTVNGRSTERSLTVKEL